MWRDELQVFMVAESSPSLGDLFFRLKYEAHPGLWYALVWLVTRITSDPTWMQVLHIALASWTWVIVYRWSPFGTGEKFLILMSYFLFWEYFVISRSYVLVALIGLAFVALRTSRPRQEFVPWLLLGLLANTVVQGTIWSLALAAMLALRERWCTPTYLAGGATYLACLALAVITMIPAPDYGHLGGDVRIDPSRFNDVLAIPFGAFVPLTPRLLQDTFAFLADPSAASFPPFRNPNPISDFIALTHATTDYPLRLALVFAAPLAFCWLITREPRRVLEFTIVYSGILLFASLWDFPGRARHHGILFLALVACAWTSRVERPPDIWSSCLFRTLLIINALGGILTLSSELQPFSQGRNAAEWLKRNNLEDTFLIGSRDAQASTVAGYLGRPIYYLECECRGTFIVRNSTRQPHLSAAEFARRLQRALGSSQQNEAVLIRNRTIAIEDMIGVPDLSIALLQTFVGAVTNESFWVYRVTKKVPP